jgi:hypothetical protein
MNQYQVMIHCHVGRIYWVSAHVVESCQIEGTSAPHVSAEVFVNLNHAAIQVHEYLNHCELVSCIMYYITVTYIMSAIIFQVVLKPLTHMNFI